jgi:hypothetical protein
MDDGVHRKAMALVVIGAGPVLADVGVVDGGGEKELAEIVERVGERVRVREPKAAEAGGPLDQGDSQAVEGAIGG